MSTPGNDTYYGQGQGMQMVVSFPFLRQPHHATTSSGFVFSLSDRPRVDHFDPDGRLTTSLRVPNSALALTLDDPEAVLDDFVNELPEEMRGLLREVVSGVEVPERWPPIGGLLVDDEDRVWVEAYRPDGTPERPWHAFGPEGAYLGRLTVPGRFDLHLIRRGTVVGVWRDELDVQSVRVYGLRQQSAG